jgi:hypothetical protein
LGSVDVLTHTGKGQYDRLDPNNFHNPQGTPHTNANAGSPEILDHAIFSVNRLSLALGQG